MKPICMGLDLGSKTCGIALSDGLGLYAHPLTTILFKSEYYEECLEKLLPIVEEHKVEQIVLGLPKMMNNDLGPRAQISLMFKEMLEEVFSGRIILMDERLSTMSSHKALIKSNKKRKDRKKVIDQVAAVEILQRYLDRGIVNG